MQILGWTFNQWARAFGWWDGEKPQSLFDASKVQMEWRKARRYYPDEKCAIIGASPEMDYETAESLFCFSIGGGLS